MKRVDKRKKWILYACVVLAYYVVPYILMSVPGLKEGPLAPENFLSFVFWPGAGLFLALFYALLVRKKKKWWILPLMSLPGVVLQLVCFSQFPLFVPFLFLIFQATGFGMIYFWSEI